MSPYFQHHLTYGPAHDEGISTFENVASPSELEFRLRYESSLEIEIRTGHSMLATKLNS